MGTDKARAAVLGERPSRKGRSISTEQPEGDTVQPRVRLSIVLVVVVLISIQTLALAPVQGQSPTNAIFLPLIIKDRVRPTIHITSVPACGSLEKLKGTVTGVRPDAFKVAVYIYTAGWWNKPYWAEPLTAINQNTTWETVVATGANDTTASRYAAFLVPNGYAPPLLAGDHEFPAELMQNAVASVIVQRDCTRKIQFSGYTWEVKAGVSPLGPGPNYFSDDPENVFVDDQGRLHLRIVQRDGIWYCAEVVHKESLGYGRYIFHLASRVDNLDPNVVVGLFTYDETSADYAHREIDIEHSRWGDAENDNSQFVVQPYNIPGNMHRFNLDQSGDASTQAFAWRPESVFYQSIEGDQPFPATSGVVASWTYTGSSLPPPGNERTRINLWLLDGVAPGEETEVIVDRFEFLPNLATPTIAPTPTATAIPTPTLTPSPTPTPTVTPTAGPPSIAFTSVPDCGAYGSLSGRVENVDPADYRVVVYIYVSGWWVKPTYSNPLTTINPDGSWSANVTTGGSDAWATQYAAFVIPEGYSPPLLGGTGQLPDELYQNSVAHTIVDRPCSR